MLEIARRKKWIGEKVPVVVVRRLNSSEWILLALRRMILWLTNRQYGLIPDRSLMLRFRGSDRLGFSFRL